MTPHDWPAVRDIYAAGIATGNATFETAPPTWERWDAGHLADHRLVATNDEDIVVGWAALSAVSDRWVYAGRREQPMQTSRRHRVARIHRARRCTSEPTLRRVGGALLTADRREREGSGAAGDGDGDDRAMTRAGAAVRGPGAGTRRAAALREGRPTTTYGRGTPIMRGRVQVGRLRRERLLGAWRVTHAGTETSWAAHPGVLRDGA